MIANLFANLGSIEDSPSPYIVHLNTVDLMEVFLFGFGMRVGGRTVLLITLSIIIFLPPPIFGVQ